MKPAALLLALFCLPAMGEPAPDPDAELWTNTPEVFPVPAATENQGVFLKVESAADGWATCVFVNNTGKSVFISVDGRAAFYSLEKPAGKGIWTKVARNLDCGDLGMLEEIPARHCHRFLVGSDTPVVRVSLYYYPKRPEKQEDISLKRVTWSREIHLGEKKSGAAPPAE